MKKTLGILMILAAMAFSGCSKEEPVVRFFYLEHCPTCDTYKQAEEIVALLDGLDRRDYRTSGYNLILPENADILESTLVEANREDLFGVLPLLVHPAGAVWGYQAVREWVEKQQD